VLKSTDSRRKGWSKINEKALTVDTDRLPNLNIIAGISNFGEFFFTVNRGKTNSSTFKLYLLRLVQVLTEKDPSWREKTVLMLDNAPYHRSKVLMNFYKAFKLPVMFLGPYQFDMAPIEMFFSFLKGRDLNEKGLNLNGQ
jgi:transposase